MTTAGSDEKVQMCRKLGANLVVNYSTGDIDEALREFGAVDVWWENLREPNLERAVGHLAMRGRIVLMAGRDARPRLPVGPFYPSDARMFGFAMFNAPADEQRKAAAEINRWMARGKLASADRPGDEALRDGRGPQPARSQHAGEEEPPGGQDRAGAVSQSSQSLSPVVAAYILRSRN